jgi:hypothetical protein
MTPDVHVLDAYFARVRSRSMTLQDKPSTRRLVRLRRRIASGEPIVVTGETIIRDVIPDVPGVEPDFWYRLCADGTIERLRPYRGKRDTPPHLAAD